MTRIASVAARRHSQMTHSPIAPTSDCPLMTKIALICFFACAFCIALPCQDSAYCSPRTVHSTPDSLFKRYDHLLKDPKATRDDWLKLIAALLKVQEKGQKGEAPRALLYAGRGALALYAKSGKREDLDKAIELFNALVRNYEKTSYFIDGLKELKRAHEMRLRLLNRISPIESSSQANHKDKSSVQESPQAPHGGAEPEQSSKRILTEAPQEAGVAPAQPDQSLRSPSAVKIGNPYYGGAVSEAPWAAPTHAVAVRERKHAKAAMRVRPHVRETHGRPLVIVLDPGHGGKDPGAVSPDGSMKEKDFTLDVCLRIQKRLHELLPEADIRLTRNNDTYLALVERAEVANSLNADIFLSIHGNAYADARAGGVETFYLSAAKSRGAMRVAARENGISLARMTDLQATLVDLVVTGKKTESALLAHEVHNSLISTLKQRHHAARDRGVKTAPFYVLLGAKMPAILIECVFLTSINDRKNLLAENKLNDIAEGIARGALNYILHNGEKTGSPSLTTSLESQNPS